MMCGALRSLVIPQLVRTSLLNPAHMDLFVLLGATQIVAVYMRTFRNSALLSKGSE